MPKEKIIYEKLSLASATVSFEGLYLPVLRDQLVWFERYLYNIGTWYMPVYGIVM